LDIDPEFWEVYDQKSGETIPREQIVLEGRGSRTIRDTDSRTQ